MLKAASSSPQEPSKVRRRSEATGIPYKKSLYAHTKMLQNNSEPTLAERIRA